MDAVVHGPQAPSLGDPELVRRARAGDALAFNDLFSRYRGPIHRLAYLTTRDAGVAEDIVVETMTRAYRSLSTLAPETTLRPWLLRVALNLAYNHLGRRRLPALSLDANDVDEERADEVDSPADLAEVGERRRIVRGAVEQLRPHLRAIVVLVYIEELRLTEVAERLGIPLGTVKSRLNTALRELRARLGDDPLFAAAASAREGRLAEAS
ncbi:MAG TPA: sigma-70 family RNA polymerase sigma factor [Candidatus Limnocylindrales bacterium]|nr:sigma-70 family RNA polymerase sigma factor [Candidatus Limnocylindrales bacterium]